MADRFGADPAAAARHWNAHGVYQPERLENRFALGAYLQARPDVVLAAAEAVGEEGLTADALAVFALGYYLVVDRARDSIAA